MPCYTCSRCNKCGIFSIRLELRCATCGADVVIGKKACPECGASYRNNIKRGMMGKPKGTKDYYTSIEEVRGEDAHRMVDMSKIGNEGWRAPGQPGMPGVIQEQADNPGKKKGAAR